MRRQLSGRRRPGPGCRVFLCCLLMTGLLSRGVAAAAASLNEVVEKGLSINFSVDPAGGSKVVTQGDLASVRFHISDASSGAPVSGLRPAVWLDLIKPAEKADNDPAAACREKIKVYLKGNLASRPDIDLNTYYILSMNDDASISVIDPLVAMTGRTNLLAMILLNRPGEDWVRGRNDRRLFVTMPKAGQVAVLDTETFSVLKNIDAGINPVRIALQPDARYLWVGNDPADTGVGGVTVIDAVTLSPAATIRTGRGHHEIAFSEDSLSAFITNAEDGTVSVVDIQTLKKIREIRTGDRPMAIAASGLAHAVYVVHETSGTVAVIDTESRELIRQITLKPGLASVRFEPGGRWGFVTNKKEGTVEILDSSMGRIVQKTAVGRGPDRISFTEGFAYIQLSGAADVAVIPMSSVGRDENLPVLKIVAGERPPGEYLNHASADTIVPSGENATVLITNPADGLIYYYMEGMEVSMGSFRSYGRVPRAVHVIDRNIRETAKGTYSAKTKLPLAGRYRVAMLLDSPRLTACFEFDAKPDPSAAGKDDKKQVRVDVLTEDNTIIAGTETVFRFRLKDLDSNEPITGVGDITTILTRTPGAWKQRYPAVPLENGSYEIRIRVPEPGVYYLFLGSRSLNAGYARIPYSVLNAKDSDLRETGRRREAR
ncbi:MAG: hypothetical protein EPN25_00175 [Nitrospirae bacterium]|nr:MAG: hypothetical protein EPN25_00175 [Nitrospirota bacterium]